MDLRLVHCNPVCPGLLGYMRRKMQSGTPINHERNCCEGTDEAYSERGRMMEDRWISVGEIADHLGIKRDTVYKWISERQMPGLKIRSAMEVRQERSGRVGKVWRSRRKGLTKT